MDIARLRTLRELSVRKTMAAVAEALLLSPSAISQQLSQLESEAGVQLVDRRGRGVALTPAGERLARYAEQIMGLVDEARTEMAELKRVVAGELRVAAFPSIAGVLIPSAMRELSRSHPQLRVMFEELEPDEGVAALRAWQADVALVDDLTLSGAARDGVETIPLTDDELFVLLPEAHPLADRGEVALELLRDARWAFDTGPHAYADVLARACKSAGFEPLVVAKCNSLEVVVELVRAGCALAILPGYRFRPGWEDLRACRIVPAIRRRIFVAHRKGEGKNPAVAAFVARVVALAAGLEARR